MAARHIVLLWCFATCVVGDLDFRCRCTPEDECWPTTKEWDTLNATVSGKLIASEPLALSCYPGKSYDASLCTVIKHQWSNASFQSENPIGLSFPINITCPVVDIKEGELPGSCTIGPNPPFVVNATSTGDVSATIAFATKHNVRVVIKDTGHDLLGRSDGYGSLEIWIRHLRTGITFQESFAPSDSCRKAGWVGNCFKIGGGYTWKDVHAEAKARNVIVVGGGTKSVSALGGWMQGGGHGPASRQFGLGSDQVLEATVVLADGRVVLASPCQNSDVFFAIRGGGPGTYGVVVSTTVKAWPMANVTVQHLAVGSLTTNYDALLDAVSHLYSAYPDLNEAGFSGYGSWQITGPAPLFSNFTAGYVHGFWMLNKTEQDARRAFRSTLARLLPQNMTSLFVDVSYSTYADYWTFYQAESGVESPVGSSGFVLQSRLFDRSSVQKNPTRLREMITAVAGTPDQFTINTVALVSGGQVFRNSKDTFTGLNPVWRRSHFFQITARGWPEGTDEATAQSIRDDITFVKSKAMEKLAPDTAAYMNEANRLDLDYEQNFYGVHYEKLLAIKKARDPKGVFYCPTCVGSREWYQDPDGRLCRRTRVVRSFAGAQLTAN